MRTDGRKCHNDERSRQLQKASEPDISGDGYEEST